MVFRALALITILASASVPCCMGDTIELTQLQQEDSRQIPDAKTLLGPNEDNEDMFLPTTTKPQRILKSSKGGKKGSKGSKSVVFADPTHPVGTGKYYKSRKSPKSIPMSDSSSSAGGSVFGFQTPSKVDHHGKKKKKCRPSRPFFAGGGAKASKGGFKSSKGGSKGSRNRERYHRHYYEDCKEEEEDDDPKRPRTIEAILCPMFPFLPVCWTSQMMTPRPPPTPPPITLPPWPWTPTAAPTGPVIISFPPFLFPTVSPAPTELAATGTCTGNVTLDSGSIVSVELDIDGQSIEGQVELNPTRYHFTYVIEVSASTRSVCNPTANVNDQVRTLTCEVEAIRALNQKIIDSNIAASVSLVPYGNTASSFFFGNPADERFQTRLDSLRSIGSIADYAGAIETIQNSIATAQQQDDLFAGSYVIFLSDGEITGTEKLQIDQLIATGTTIQTYALGSNVVCDGELQDLADRSGGTCTNVVDASTLDTILETQIELPEPDFVDTIELTVENSIIPLTQTPNLPLTSRSNLAPIEEMVRADLEGNEVCLAARSGVNEAICCVIPTISNETSIDADGFPPI